MGPGYILDSNVLIDLVGQKLPAQTIQKITKSILFASDISRIEVLGFSGSSEEDSQFISLFSDIQIITLSEEVVLRTIAIRKVKKIKLGDAVIAASAIVYDIPLMTRNISDFKGIEGLIVIDSYSPNRD